MRVKEGQKSSSSSRRRKGFCEPVNRGGVAAQQDDNYANDVVDNVMGGFNNRQ